MRVIAAPIQMVAWFDESGRAHPVRFKYKVGEKEKIMPIHKILSVEEEKLAGNLMQIFECSTMFKNSEKRYQIKYEKSSMKWLLFKI